ncbi:MAG: hypothetical protein GY867_10285 [bacterium]|nr:hypothetical protein [bacterium]
MLAVGDSTQLEIIFSTKRYTSRITKTPRIETNVGPPHKNVRITTQVVRRPDSTYPVIIKPYKLDISQFGEKVRDQMKFTITNVSEQDLDLSMVYFPTDLVDVSLPASVSAGKSAEGVLRLKEPALSMSLEKSFTFQLNDADGSRFTVPIKRTIKNPSNIKKPGVKTKAGK